MTHLASWVDSAPEREKRELLARLFRWQLDEMGGGILQIQLGPLGWRVKISRGMEEYVAAHGNTVEEAIENAVYAQESGRNDGKATAA